MNRVFISYSRKNEAFAERLARDLADAGLDVWIDLRQIHGGEFWQQEIFRGLQRADFIVVIMSEFSLSSEWVAREVEFGRENGKRIYPILISDVFAAIQQSERWRWLLDVQFIDFRGQYETAFPELMQSLPGGRRLGVFDTFDPDDVPNPFKGLEAFQQRDAAFFFGREELVQKALLRMQRTRFLAVVGASGSGKSSLVRAGVVPQIRAGKLPKSENWPIVIFTPDSNPIESFASRLGPLLPVAEGTDPMPQLLQALLDAQNFDALVASALHKNPPDARLLIVIDQFEEVFTRANERERDAFLQLIVAGEASASSRVQFIATMRADFFGELSTYPPLAELFEQDHLLIVTEMTPANLLRVIEGPAQAVGLEYERGLVDRILEDVNDQPGSLPLLQYALSELFNRREAARLTLKAYNDIGGVQRALARHAESIYTAMGERQQTITRKVLLRLVEVSTAGEATRRRVRREEVNFHDVPNAEVQRVVEILTAQDARLLIASRDVGGRRSAPVVWLEIGHEALIREWDRLRSWVTDSQEDLIYDAELRKSAENWAASGQDVSFLLTGRRLNRAEIWLETADPTALQQELIQASLDERDRQQAAEAERVQRELELQRQSVRRARWLGAVFAVSFLLAIGGLFLLNQTNTQLQETVAERDAANADLSAALDLAAEREREARSLAVAALASDNEGDLALSLAVEAAKIEAAPSQAQRTLAEIAFAPGTRQRIDLESTATALAYSPDADGRLFAIGRNDGQVMLFDSASGVPFGTYAEHTSVVTQVAIDPDLRYLLSASEDEVLLWPLDAMQQPNQGRGLLIEPLVRIPLDANGGSRVSGLGFLRNPTRAVIAGVDGWIEVYEVAGGVLDYDTAYVPPADDAAASITQMVVGSSNDGQQVLISATQGGALRLHDLDNPQLTLPFSDEIAVEISAIALDMANREVLVAYTDGNLALYDLDTRLPVTVFPTLQARIVGVSFVPQSRYFVVITEDNSLRLWDRGIERQINRFLIEGTMRAVVASPNGQNVLTSADNRTLRIWDILGSAELSNFGNNLRVNALALNSAGTRAISGSTDGTLYVWDTLAGELRQGLPLQSNAWVTSVALDPTDTLYAAGTSLGRVYIIQANTLNILREIRASDSIILSLTFDTDGSRLATTSTNRTIQLWDVNTGANLQTFTGHEGNVFAVAISPDGQRLLSGSQDDTMRLWDVQSGAQLRLFDGHEGDVRSVAFNADATRAASAATDATIRLWNLDNQREVLPLVGHTSTVRYVEFLPDGRAVVSGSDDGSVRLWDASTGFELRRYDTLDEAGNRQPVQGMDLGASGNLAVTALRDNSMRVWQFIPQKNDLISWTQANRFVRPLDCNERLLFSVDGTNENGQLYEVVQRDTAIRTDPQASAEALVAVDAGTLVRRLASDELADASAPWLAVCTLQGDEGWIAKDDLAISSP